MNIVAEKSSLSGQVQIPGSKSHTIRAVAIAALAKGTSEIKNPLISDDTLSAVSCYRSLGAEIKTTDNSNWIVKGVAGKPAFKSKTINVGNSGTTLRIALGSACLADPGVTVEFTGDEQICSRPIAPLLQSLNNLGATTESIKNNGNPPVIASGKLRGGQTTIECFTSQYLSSLLMAAPLCEQQTHIDVSLLNEPDYVQITLDWLVKQGIKYENNDLKSFIVAPQQSYQAFNERIPADFSSATFFLCAGAILDADLSICGLDFSDSQPDKAVVDYLKQMGADITIEDSCVKIKRSNLTGSEIDMNRTPDALPAMSVTAAFAKGKTVLRNVPQARKKETDRIACMANELKKFGTRVEELPDGIIIHGGNKLSPAVANGHHDHRIVMALSLMGMALDGQTIIETAEAMNVTFPEYIHLMQSLKANLKRT